jgi:bla regulator protein blaR1
MELIVFFIKLNVSLSVVYVFYQLVLRPMTFYNWNRWYLLCYPAISFVIALIDINVFVSETSIVKSAALQLIPILESPGISNNGSSWFENDLNLLTSVFVTGVMVMLARFFAQLYSYMRLRKSSMLLSDFPVKIYAVDKAIIPFSFGDSIFINKQMHNDEDLTKIIQHEFVHVRQKHTADIIFGEILCILNWYNPFAWLLKKSIRQNLEFIVDEQVLLHGLHKRDYQYLLLKISGGAAYRITNHFNLSFLKKRITMMNKQKRHRCTH